MWKLSWRFSFIPLLRSKLYKSLMPNYARRCYRLVGYETAILNVAYNGRAEVCLTTFLPQISHYLPADFCFCMSAKVTFRIAGLWNKLAGCFTGFPLSREWRGSMWKQSPISSFPRKRESSSSSQVINQKLKFHWVHNKILGNDPYEGWRRIKVCSGLSKSSAAVKASTT